jgi:hypothetical protein
MSSLDSLNDGLYATETIWLQAENLPKAIDILGWKEKMLALPTERWGFPHKMYEQMRDGTYWIGPCSQPTFRIYISIDNPPEDTL